MTIIRQKCKLCTAKIPKFQPKLVCSLCNAIKHLKCEGLSKSDVHSMRNTGFDWTCHQCISSILPVNACPNVTQKTNRNTPQF